MRFCSFILLGLVAAALTLDNVGAQNLLRGGPLGDRQLYNNNNNAVKSNCKDCPIYHVPEPHKCPIYETGVLKGEKDC